MSTPDTPDYTLLIVRVLSAIALLAAGGIHLFLVLTGTGGPLGVAFVLNFVAGLVLGVGMALVPPRFLLGVTVLGLLFLIASLGALLVAITVGLFGVQPSWDYPLVVETVVVESFGIITLAVATVIVFRDRRAQLARRR